MPRMIYKSISFCNPKGGDHEAQAVQRTEPGRAGGLFGRSGRSQGRADPDSQTAGYSDDRRLHPALRRRGLHEHGGVRPGLSRVAERLSRTAGRHSLARHIQSGLQRDRAGRLFGLFPPLDADLAPPPGPRSGRGRRQCLAPRPPSGRHRGVHRQRLGGGKRPDARAGQLETGASHFGEAARGRDDGVSRQMVSRAENGASR